MILDHFENIHLYRALAAPLRRGLEFLVTTDLTQLETGRIEIDGENVFALIQEYDTRPPADCRWESHLAYCDIQCIARGVEQIGVTQADRVTLTSPHDTERDVAFYDGSGDFLELRPGMFLVIWPQDIHMPCIARDKPCRVRKIVVKARFFP